MKQDLIKDGHQISKVGEMYWIPEYKGSVIEIDQEKEARCPVCGRLLFRGVLGSGTKIEIMCSRNRKICKNIIRIEKY